jgi:3-oxoacyl-[acyl-carrier-protein] synthase-1
LWYASNLIRAGKITHALVLGVEIFNRITAFGFSGLQLLTRDVMRPFDRRRSGLVPGEACAAIVLSAKPTSTCDWRISGGANICDIHGITATNPDGSAVAEVVRLALREGGVKADEIAAIKVHGTASLSNDESESKGILRVFPQPPALCALKPYLGHTFGACGAAELAIFCGSVSQGMLPGTPGICAEPSDLGVALNQRLVAQQRGTFMLNHFGFGGSNTSLIVTNRVDRPS